MSDELDDAMEGLRRIREELDELIEREKREVVRLALRSPEKVARDLWGEEWEPDSFFSCPLCSLGMDPAFGVCRSCQRVYLQQEFEGPVPWDSLLERLRRRAE